MKQILLTMALGFVVAGFGFWLAAGANRGWTQNRVPKKTLDAVTGIEGVSYEKKFVPGLDFLGAALVAAGVLAGASFLCKNKTAS